ncbi:MAG: dihydrofolate reductase [Clostridia bacterium]|nr:dihydrofolate reductase [Clostridia bacterium]
MNITIIAAVGKNNELGKNNDLIWRFKEDMKFFKESTTGKPIVMGLNTFYSLPKLLPNRKHIVLSNVPVSLPEEVTVVNSMEKLLRLIHSLDQEVMIIGGASIYHQFMPFANKLLLTEIDASSEADVYFPAFEKSEWEKKILSVQEENGITFEHVEYMKK